MTIDLRQRLLGVEAGLERPVVRRIETARLVALARWRAVRRGLAASAAIALCAALWPWTPGVPARGGADAAAFAELRLRARAALVSSLRDDSTRDARIRAMEAASVRSLVATLRTGARQRAREEIRERKERR